MTYPLLFISGFLLGYLAVWLDSRSEIRRLERMNAKSIARAAEAEKDRDAAERDKEIVRRIYKKHVDTHRCVKIEVVEEWPEIIGG